LGREKGKKEKKEKSMSSWEESVFEKVNRLRASWGGDLSKRRGGTE